MTVCVVVILQAVERVVVSVAVDGAHGRTWGVAAVEVSAMTHAEGGEPSGVSRKEMTVIGRLCKSLGNGLSITCRITAILLKIYFYHCSFWCFGRVGDAYHL